MPSHRGWPGGQRVGHPGLRRVLPGEGRPEGHCCRTLCCRSFRPPAFRDRVKFSNRGIAQAIPRVLNEMGYSVDIVNYDNRSWFPDRPYDLFIGHGGINFEADLPAPFGTYGPDLFLHGDLLEGVERSSTRRAADLVSRRGVAISPYRTDRIRRGLRVEVPMALFAWGITGRSRPMSEFPKVIGINNAVFPVAWEGWRKKDFEEGRRHFLFFSGRGNVLKGLDLLLEAFTGIDLHLHVCQHLERDFFRTYWWELNKCPNIHIHGFVRMRSTEFLALAMRCNWVISPTCAEGQPGAVLGVHGTRDGPYSVCRSEHRSRKMWSPASGLSYRYDTIGDYTREQSGNN